MKNGLWKFVVDEIQNESLSMMEQQPGKAAAK